MGRSRTDIRKMPQLIRTANRPAARPNSHLRALLNLFKGTIQWVRTGICRSNFYISKTNRKRLKCADLRQELAEMVYSLAQS